MSVPIDRGAARDYPLTQATVTEQGQITIPMWICEALNLRPGDRIEFMIRGEDDRGVLRPSIAMR